MAFDNASTDGTLEEIRKYTDRIHHVPAGAYVPGRVLNQAMAATEGEFVVFLNSDCTPQDDCMLDALLAGFVDDKVAAVFGRQMSRPGCRPLMAKDTEDTYGDGSRQALWRHCFSMAVSAIRRSVWERMPFQEDLQYSEDIDWTWRARRCGYEIRYAAGARVIHSHNYSLRQFYRRHFGEGRAEAHIFEWSPWERSLVRYSLLPYASAGGERLEILRRQFAGGIGAVFAGAADGADGGPAARIFEFVARVWQGVRPMAGEATDSAQLLYARHASADFNARMQGWLTSLSGEVRQAMGENLIALVLGGGYGRGEGGVLRVSTEPELEGPGMGGSLKPSHTERPYNDLDLVLVVRRKAGVPWEALHGDPAQVRGVDGNRGGLQPAVDGGRRARVAAHADVVRPVAGAPGAGRSGEIF